MSYKKEITQRLSLRLPQKEALDVLERIGELITFSKQEPLSQISEIIRKEFPNFTDFERDFPNICLALATGVGKTRLMGAFVAYLASVKGIRHFMILAPNRTILEKLEREFRDPNNGKYVFKGLGEIASRVKIITAENYNSGTGLRNDRRKQLEFFDQDEIHINIFNIAMIHTKNEVSRKIKKETEIIPEGYFKYLAGLSDLIVFMDEAHRYRSEGATQALNELKPVLGIELTATPFIEKGDKKRIPFKNTILEYPLSRAIQDGFVKQPWVAGRENFNIADYDEEAIEKLKIQDGITIHEQTKLHLQSYAQENNCVPIKPFMLIIAEDTAHANRLRSLVESPDFLSGRYIGKVNTVHSKLDAEEEEKMVRELLSIEEHHNSTEIVIHVNMLREGWDVVNLYTIVPLRTANSKNLIEQQIGRGLRLPYGELTGKVEIDRLTLVSHDKFNEIIDEANKPDSLIRSGLMIGKDISEKGYYLQEVLPKSEENLLSTMAENQRNVIRSVIEEIEKMGTVSDEEIAKKIIATATDRGVELQSCTHVSVVRELKDLRTGLSIKVPRITVEPYSKRGSRFLPFNLDLKAFTPQPFDQELLLQNLSTGTRDRIDTKNGLNSEENPFEALLNDLLNLDGVVDCEDTLDLVEDLAKQAISHLRSYLIDEEKIKQVFSQNRKLLVQYIYKQMIHHYDAGIEEFEITGDGYDLLPRQQTRFEVLQIKQTPINVKIPIDTKSAIKDFVFNGFNKSLYSILKFDSDPERVFAIVLENSETVKKWLKLSKGQIRNIFYTSDSSSYIPDFLVETDKRLFLCEIKRKCDMESKEVIQKARAATQWCDSATKQAKQNSEKPWSYLLIPHDEVAINMSFDGLAIKYGVYE